MNQSKYYAIYDFGIFPYALGDVLTWNVQTAIKAADAGRQSIDVLVVIDPDYPASIFQSDFISKDNCPLMFNELFGAFGTMPGIGNVNIFRNRSELLGYLNIVAADDNIIHQVVEDYKAIVEQSDDVDAVAAYFITQLYSCGTDFVGQAHEAVAWHTRYDQTRAWSDEGILLTGHPSPDGRLCCHTCT